MIHPTHKDRSELTVLKYLAEKPNKFDHCSQSSLGVEAIPEYQVLQARLSPTELDLVPVLPNNGLSHACTHQYYVTRKSQQPAFNLCKPADSLYPS